MALAETLGPTGPLPQLADDQAPALVRTRAPGAARVTDSPAVPTGPAGRPARPPDRIRRHAAKFTVFAAVGGLVFVAGLALQVLLVRRFQLGTVISYGIQVLLSIQLNFALNRMLTWRDRRIRVWRAFLRFNIQRITVLAPALLLYAGLEALGLHYLLANAVTTATFMAVNYAIAHLWSFAPIAPSAPRLAPDHPGELAPPSWQTPVPGERAPWQIPGDGARPAPVSLGQRLGRFPWPFAAVLAVQAALSLRLVWTNTAYEDEALYLWAGHLQLAHWLHGLAIPPFPTYFSGAPVIYPVIGALSEGLGGLAAARILSLCFMLGATTLLWMTTSRLFGRRAAFFAVAAWALLGATIRLGAFATYDPMSLFLLAAAAWFATGGTGRRDPTKWMFAAAVMLTLANATKYATALFDPVVAGMALLTGYPQPGGKGAWRRAAFLASCTVVLIIFLLQIGRGWYLDGISQTTLARQHGGTPVGIVLASSWAWIGVVVVASAVGAVLGLTAGIGAHQRLMLLMLAATALLVPIEQARIHDATSLSKHVAFGAWFAAIAIGYGANRIVTWFRPRIVRAVLALGLSAAALPVAVAGVAQADSLYTWPGAGNVVPVLAGPTRSGGRFLADNSATLQYYLPRTSWKQWSNVHVITLPSGRRVAQKGDDFAPYRQALARHYFKLVVLAFTDKPELDSKIASYLRTDPSYRFVGSVPFSNPGAHGGYLVWVYGPSADGHP